LWYESLLEQTKREGHIPYHIPSMEMVDAYLDWLAYGTEFCRDRLKRLIFDVYDDEMDLK
ncbi:MAG: hypothetical protein J6Y37_06760, partial [Paludibacteraceae bacterium]|nr:hypothetical protein [Paludibacteraceae bacterium]